MDILQILLGVLIGVGATTYKNKKIEKTKNTKEEKIGFNIIHKEDLMATIKNLAYTDEIKKIKIIEKNKNQKKYGYRRNGYLFEIEIKEHKIKCEVTKTNDEKKETILEFEYDQYWGKYINKKFLRSVIENHQEKESIKVLEHFMDRISKKINWDSLDEVLKVVDDVNFIKEDIQENEQQQIIKEIDNSIETVNREIGNSDISEDFIETLNALKEVNEKINFEKILLPIYVKRKYKEVNLREINNLKTYYLELSNESRVTKELEIKEVLKKIKEDSKETLKLAEEKTNSNLNSTIEFLKRAE